MIANLAASKLNDRLSCVKCNVTNSKITNNSQHGDWAFMCIEMEHKKFTFKLGIGLRHSLFHACQISCRETLATVTARFL